MFAVAVAMGLLNSLGEPPKVRSDGLVTPDLTRSDLPKSFGDWSDIEEKLGPRLKLSEMISRIDTPVRSIYFSSSCSQDIFALRLSAGGVTDITIRKPIRYEQFDWNSMQDNRTFTPVTPLFPPAVDKANY